MSVIPNLHYEVKKVKNGGLEGLSGQGLMDCEYNSCRVEGETRFPESHEREEKERYEGTCL